MKSLSQHILEHFANIDQSTNTEIVQESTNTSPEETNTNENKEEETED